MKISTTIAIVATGVICNLIGFGFGGYAAEAQTFNSCLSSGGAQLADRFITCHPASGIQAKK